MSVRPSRPTPPRPLPGSPADRAVERDDETGPDLPNIPLVDDAIEHEVPSDGPGAGTEAGVEVRPTWRGWIHAGTFPVSIVAGVVLVLAADGAAARWAAVVFATTSLLLFGNSALYHRFDWQPRTKVILKRIDHANIFLLIAGTYTPLAVLALPPEQGRLLLILVWSGALLGIAFRVFWIHAPRWLYVPLYLLLGYASLLYLGPLFDANAAMMTLVLVGGLCYTVGAIVYGVKRPNPVPGVFGFHEIFHALTVVAFLCHWTAALLISIDPAYNAG